MKRALTLAVVTLALLPASALGIGADLNRPANAAFGCELAPTTDAFGNRAFLPSSFTQGILGVGQAITSCTYLSVGGLSGQQEIIQAPTPGIFTVARVKTGPVVGPMQVTVLRAIRGGTGTGEAAGPGIACCIFRRASQVFVPAPNAVTAVVVNLPVNVNVLPTDAAVGESFDYLALTVLAPGVPIPAHDIGTPGDIRQPGALAFFPGIGPDRPERVDGAGVGALVPLLNADFVPCLLAAGVRAKAAQVGSPCALVPGADAIAPRVLRLSRAGRRLRVRVSEPAVVTLALARRRGRSFVTVRRLTARAPRGGTISIAVPRAIAGTLRVIATARDGAGNGSAAVTRTVTLPRP
jgi:hypothetical protein